MAVVQNPITGRSRGKFSNAVFTKWKNLNVLKSKPLSVANPQSPAQVMRRGMFSQLVEYGRTFRSVIETGFETFKDTETWMNSFIKYNNGVVVIAGTAPDFTVDLLPIITSRGPLTPTDIDNATGADGSADVTVNFSASVDGLDQTLLDTAFILVTNTTQGEFGVSAGTVARSAGTAVVTLSGSASTGDVIGVAIFFQSDNDGSVGDSSNLSITI